MDKLINIDNLNKLSKAFDARYKELINEEKARAIDEEEALQSEIDITKEMFDGKSIKYVTQAEYDVLTEEEKNNETVTYFITDAVDLSHEHENKEFLDGLSQGALDEKYITAVDYDNSDIIIEETFTNYGLQETLQTLGYVTLNNFDSLNDAIEYCRNNHVKLCLKDITLTEDTSFRGVYLEVIGTIHLNGFNLELGGLEDLKSKKGEMAYDHPQYINNIYTTNKSEKVFIRDCIGIKLTINYYIGTLYFRLNNECPRIAFSNFNLKTVDAIDISDDELNSDGSIVDTNETLWFNENSFFLNRCRLFKMSGSHNHNTNRIYGGCFEGRGGITLETGSDNIFYDVRNEGDFDITTIKFGVETRNNIIYSLQDYNIKFIDEGFGNKYINRNIRELRLITHDKLTSKMVANGNTGVFENIVMNDTNDAFKPNGYTINDKIYESEFLDAYKSFMVTIESKLKSGPGFSVMYKVYDENFNEITKDILYAHAKYSFMKLSTVVDGSSQYFLADATQTNNYNEDRSIVSNDYLVLENSDEYLYLYENDRVNYPDMPKIKYIKFFINFHQYKNACVGTEFFSIYVSIYDKSCDYRLRYLNNVTNKQPE